MQPGGMTVTITRVARGAWLGALLLALAGGSGVLTLMRPGAPTPEATAAGTFLETFDGSPGSPQPFTSSRVAVTRTERNLPGDNLQPAHHSMHGADCAGPPATFTNNGSRAMSVYQCRDHIMTSISGTPYGLVYLTPTALVDWSGGSATISWRQSTARSSARDFLSVWITPWANVLDLPAPVAVDNDLNGAPLNAIHFVMDFFTDRITPEAYFNGAVRYYNESSVIPYSRVVVPDNARRDLFEMTITASSVELRLNGTVIARGDGLTVPFTSGMVQFGHHSYSPGKGCGATYVDALINQCVNGNDIASSNTWHWDDFSINPSLPASFLQGAPDYSTGGRVSLPAPAQSGSRLRFNAIGRVELSWNGGSTWAVAPVQPGNQERDELHVASYWVPAPAGATGFDIRLSVDGPYPSQMLHAKDFTVWAAAAGTEAVATTVVATPADATGATATTTTAPAARTTGGAGTTSAGASIVQTGTTSALLASGTADAAGSFRSADGAFVLQLTAGVTGARIELRSLPPAQLPAALPSGTSLLGGAVFALQLQDGFGGSLTSPFAATFGLAGVGADPGTVTVLQFDDASRAWVQVPSAMYTGARVAFRANRAATYAIVSAPAVTQTLRGGTLSALTFTGADGTLVEDLDAQIGPGVAALWRWDATAQDFQRYIPGAPAFVNTLRQVDRRAVLFARMQPGADVPWRTPDLFTSGTTRDVTLRAGLNAFGLTGDDAAVTSLLASLGANLQSAQVFDAGSGVWRAYIPGAPALVNTLSSVARLQPVFVRVRTGATLQVTERGTSTR